MYRRYWKRLFDILFALSAGMLFIPLLLIIAFLVRIKLGSPVIFSQRRPGYREKVFTLYKFRTMTDTRDAEGKLLPDAERLTVFGKWLRALSLDELPELWNILCGDMSLIGPRPLAVQYLPLYNERQRRRHEVRPGLTGLAQIKGRNLISWEKRFEYDVWYIDKLSFWLDVRIFFGTFAAVLFRRGITSATSATMEAFTGTVSTKEEVTKK